MPEKSIIFSIVDPSEGQEAFQWHREFANENAHLFPRNWDQYEELANSGQVISAKEENGDFIGLAYFIFEDGKWEVGGLMVSKDYQGKSVGSTLMRITLGYLLFEEDPLDRGEPVIAHVHVKNKDPRGIIEGALKFILRDKTKVSGKHLPGLETDKHGIVHGDEFELKLPDTLLALADWCENWNSTLRNGQSANVELRPGITLEMWAEAFRDMADRHSP